MDGKQTNELVHALAHVAVEPENGSRCSDCFGWFASFRSRRSATTNAMSCWSMDAWKKRSFARRL